MTSTSMAMRWAVSAAAGAEAAAHVPHEPLDELVVADLGGHPRGHAALEVVAVAPTVAHGPQIGARLLLGRCRRVVVGVGAAYLRVEDHQAGASFRVGRGEQDAHAGARQPGPQHGPLGAGGIHDGSDVVHGGLERGHLAHPIREARPASIQQQEPPVESQAFDVADQQ